MPQPALLSTYFMFYGWAVTGRAGLIGVVPKYVSGYDPTLGRSAGCHSSAQRSEPPGVVPNQPGGRVSGIGLAPGLVYGSPVERT